MTIWTKNEIEFLKLNYDKYSAKELAKHLNRTINAIKIKSRKLGLLRKSKYYYQKDFFRDIQTPNQSYWLGFMYADGYVSKQKNRTNTYSVGIELSARDILHLKNFNKDINGNVSISTRHRTSKYQNKKIAGDICSIRLYCSEMGMDLINHGCCLNKSLIKTAPKNIPQALMRDFIRGYFDGNGSISNSLNKKYNQKYLKLTISSGSIEFVKWLSSYLDGMNIDNSYYSDGNCCYKIQISSNSFNSFLDYIYKDSERHLDRKYKKYLVAVYGNDTNP